MRRTTRWFRGGLGLVLLALAAGVDGPARALDPDKLPTQYVHEVWGLEDGLPQISVLDMIESRDGFLWTASYEGVARFGGVRFETFETPEATAITHALLEDRGGTLWAGTQNGLLRFAQGSFHLFTTRDGLVNDFVEVLYEDRDASLWIGTQSGLGRLRDGRFTAYTLAEGLPHESIRAILEDRNGDLWIGTEKGLVQWVGERFRLALDDALAGASVGALYEDRAGRLWIGTRGSGLGRLESGELRFYTTRDGLASDNVSAITEDTEGNLWIGTQEGGVSRLAEDDPLSPSGGTKLDTFDTERGLSDNDVRVILEDSEGSLWIGTWTGGLNRLRDGKFVPWTTQEGLADDMVLPILEDRAGDLWIGTQNGLSRFRDGEFRNWTTADGLAHDFIWALHEDRAGDLWIGTQGGLNRHRGGKLTTWTTVDGLVHDEVHAIHEDRAGDLWIGTWGGGLSRMRDGAFTSFTEQDGLAQNFVMALLEDRSGTLWIGTTHGLSRFHQGVLTTWTTADGLPNNSVASFYEDAAGDMWIGTDGGLVRHRDGDLAVFTTSDGLFNNRSFQILEDGAGNLWGSCNRGIFRVSKAELEELAEGRRPSVTSVAYGPADGMKSRECNGTYQPAGWRSRDGRLWFPTVRGAVSIDPAHIRTNERPTPVVIDRLTTETDSISLVYRTGERLELDDRDFAVHYTGLSFRNPEKITFRHRLEGYDDDWNDAGPRREAHYTNIPPGPYRFRVEARNEDGVWSESDASVELFVRPRIWETVPFYGICALALAVLGRGIYRWQVRRLVRRNRELQAMKTELEIKNAELERFTYTVSHDLKSPLYTIQGFLGFLEKDAKAGRIDQVEKDMQQIRGATSKMRRLLEELLELSRVGRRDNPSEDVPFGDLVDAALDLVAGRIREHRVEVVIGEDLPMVHGDRQRLLEVLQNLIDNAVKYMGDEASPRIEIAARRDGDTVVCSVADNGIGIDPRYREKVFGLFDQLDPEVEGTGIGLALVTRIIDVHGGRIWVESDGVGRGATFFFTLPAV